MVPSKHSTGTNCSVTIPPSLLPLINHLLTDPAIFHLFGYCSTLIPSMTPGGESILLSLSLLPCKMALTLKRGIIIEPHCFQGSFSFDISNSDLAGLAVCDPFSWTSVNLLICNSQFHSRLHASFYFPKTIWCCFLLQMCCTKWHFWETQCL